MQKAQQNRIRFSFLIVGLLLMYNNCSQPGAISVQSAVNTVSGNPGGGGGSGGGGDTGTTLKNLQPALAVRGLACLMCHADIRANVITDFGYGNPWYLGGSINFESKGDQNNQSWYNNDAHSWQSMTQLVGSIYVPNQLITSSIQADIGQAGRAPMNLQQLLTTPYDAIWLFDNDPAEAHAAMDLRVRPASGQATVVSAAQVTISAPTESEILALAPELAASSGPAFKRIGRADPVQFFVQGSGGASYVKNDESQVFDCEDSDVVVKGSLYLRNFNLKAAKGCRLYVTGTVFIENAISYQGGTPGDASLQNLQITSANAIIMGIGEAKLKGRYDDRRQAFITGARSFDDRFQQVMREAASIGSLVDAADRNPRISIDFSSLLLNAPIVQGRYLGQLKGTIVAELALFALGEFHFEFDPVFTKVNVLPRLNRAILIAK